MRKIMPNPPPRNNKQTNFVKQLIIGHKDLFVKKNMEYHVHKWIQLEHDSKIYFQIILECMSSYGENCQYTCNVYCINQTCDRINGSCLYGCKYGYQCDEGKFPRFLYFEVPTL